MMDTLKQSLSESGIPGLNTIFRVESYSRKILWLVVFLLLGTKAFLDIYSLVLDYWKYPVTVSLKVTTYDELLFPAVTICNINPVRVDRICENPSAIELPQYLENALCSRRLQKQHTSATEAPDHNSGNYTDTDDLQHYNKLLRMDLSAWLAELELRNRTLLQELGHQLETFLHRCTFLHNSCKTSSDFIKNPTAIQGNCYTINSNVGQQNSSRRISQIGPHYGLDLTLNIEPDQYLPFIEERGALILIHSSTTGGSITRHSIYLKPGESTYIGLQQVNITRLPFPYPGNCRKEWPDLLEDLRRRNLSYSTLDCQEHCLQKHIIEQCNCQAAWLPKINTNSQINICHTQGDLEIFNFLTKTTGDKLNCPCDPQCQEIVFRKTYSATNWPFIIEREKKVNKTFIEETGKTTNGLVRAIVYFQTLNSEERIQEAKYTKESIWSSIGGALGMYIGYSFLILFELLDIVFRSIKNFLINHRMIQLAPKANQ